MGWETALHRPVRVLWVTALAPDRQGAGGHRRQAHLLDALCRRAEVHLLVSEGSPDAMTVDAVASVTHVGVSDDDWSDRPRLARRARDLWLATASTQPREAAPAGSLRRAMARPLAHAGADVVIVETAALAPLIRARAAGQTWVLDLHNIGWEMAEQAAAVAPGRRQAWLYRRDALKGRRWLGPLTRRYDLVATVSPEDRRLLGTGATSCVVPNGVDSRAVRPTPLPDGPTIVFTGALSTGPNVDGVGWFCSEVFPLVRAVLPQATVAVVGARPSAVVRRLDDLDGVTVTADVASTLPYLDGARVAVVPLRIGSGTRLKALEAMAAGRPVVGTSVGLAGLGVEDGRHALVADDAEGFAAAVVRLVGDDAGARRLAGEARRLIEDHYDWGGIGERFADVVLAAARGS
ncbi:MAG: glycosyltransferase [Actinomycetota bacterium]|nr:glycosyltransferase [Actinomycetota bacterium]